jgi:hypothetical protein
MFSSVKSSLESPKGESVQLIVHPCLSSNSARTSSRLKVGTLARTDVHSKFELGFGDVRIKKYDIS